MKKIPLVVILGPTASGKSALALTLAKELDGEIVSADSMQVYRGMDILSAKPTKEEQMEVRHHLIDIIDPTDDFSVAKYSILAHDAIEDIHSRGKLAFLVGGTGLYIDSVCNDLTYADTLVDTNRRKELSDIAKTQGNDAVYKILEKKDPEAAYRLHPNNLKRVIRAIEIIETTNKSILWHEEASKPETSRYNPIYIGLTGERALLYERINRRVDIMLDMGIFDEAKRLYSVLSEHPDATCAQAIGYKEFVPVIEGTRTLTDAKEELCKNTRRYAKRQLTWFRRNDKINWVSVDDIDIPKLKKLIREGV